MNRTVRVYLLGAATLLIALAVYFLLPADCPPAARRTAVVFVIAAGCWIFDLMRPFATSMLIVLLLIVLTALPGGRFTPEAQDYRDFFAPFSNPIIILFFGSFMVAKAMSTHHIDLFLAEKLFAALGHRPYFLLAGVMATTAFISFWMSNTATTAIMLGILPAVTSQIPKDDPFRRGLVLAVPFSANIGGIATPIGTPVNAIALGSLLDLDIRLSFLRWMAVAVPLVIVVLLVAFLILVWLFPLRTKELTFRWHMQVQRTTGSWTVIAIFALMVVLWLTQPLHGLPESLVALFGALLLVATRRLGTQDVNSLNWDVLILMWGGLALSVGMLSSGLASWIVDLPVFEAKAWALVAWFSILGFILSNFISHTAAAALLVPLAVSVPGENPVVLAVTLAFSCSFGMVLPISTPPNAMAFSKNEISVREMIRGGLPISVISMVIMLICFPLILKWLIPNAF